MKGLVGQNGGGTEHRSEDPLSHLMPKAPKTPDEFAAFMRTELAKYEKVVKASGAKVD